MQCARDFGAYLRFGGVVAALGTTIALAGCGMPGAPLPPSLNLPDRVGDLAAVRTGGQVAVTWTMPTKNTDKLLLKGDAAVRVCRNEQGVAGCSAVTTLELAPGANGAFTDMLPAALVSGTPRVLTYFVELDNRKGRSAGLSNGAQILTGKAPAAISGLRAEMRRDGILLHWTAAPPEAAPVAVRLDRKLLTSPTKKPEPTGTESGLLAPPPEPLERTLLVEAGAATDRALDQDIRFGGSYEYRAQRVARVTVNGQTLELAGPLSEPVRIDALNVFPPAVPKGLAAVATPAENGVGPAIDLSWQPDTEADLAGYIVYRREANAGWQRISPAQPVVGPGYHDANVEPGHTYEYAVSAIDQQGHESARSAGAQETVPGPEGESQ
jgi:hypothetical protein